MGKCKSSGDIEADNELWRQSLQGTEDGWLDGLSTRRMKSQARLVRVDMHATVPIEAIDKSEID